MKGYNDLDKLAYLQARQLQILCAIARKLEIDDDTVKFVSVEAESILQRLEQQAVRRINQSPNIWWRDNSP